MHRAIALLALVLLVVVSFVLSLPSESLSADQPLTSGLDLSNFDRNVRPQDDLFRAVNGALACQDQDSGRPFLLRRLYSAARKGRKRSACDHRGLCQRQRDRLGATEDR